MAYTPELSQQDSCSLRRIAWALGLPMTKALERVIEHAAMKVDREKICAACRDKSLCNGGSPFYSDTACVFAR